MATNTDHSIRRISYLRVSITDRCNMRCFYCMPSEGLRLAGHTDILSYEEILRVVGIAAQSGIKKVRITGGEPLLRRNVCHLVHEIASTPGIEDVGLTTNGILLKDMARQLWNAGLRRINVSLDTLNPLKFRKVTRLGSYHDVWQGIHEAESVGFNPIRINVVAMRGINDDELGHFARLSMETTYAFRFIEYMPMGALSAWDASKFIAGSETKAKLQEYGRLLPIARNSSDGPCRRFRFEGGLGEIGFISPVSNHFCDSCDRLRLTAAGKLRSCLLSECEVDIRKSLRGNQSDWEISKLIRNAIAKRTKQHGIEPVREQGQQRAMAGIGG